jgi:glutamate N-acetyltransferase/amino-acid N-acetyltransferase
MQIKGFRFAGIACGIKASGAPDLGVIVADRPVSCAGRFTTNRVVAAPVVQSRKRLQNKGLSQFVVVNSGNANACTGPQGEADAQRMADLTGAAALTQVCSTGVIGAPLPMKALESGIPAALDAARADGIEDFAEAIRTTDGFRKLRTATVEIDGTTYGIVGAAKGAGMIHPNMATMLGFVCTDAPLDPAILDALWGRICGQSFNAITVDGDTSTNDTALMLASGEGPSLSGDALVTFEAAALALTRELALDIVRDAEGGTKVVSITVSGAPDDAAARQVADAIALSPLVKTAFHGEDPNWGRIIAAAGRSGVAVEPDRMRLSIGGEPLFWDGRWQGPDAEAKIHTIMTGDAYPLRLELGLGSGEAVVHTCDFSRDYIRINADYRS